MYSLLRNLLFQLPTEISHDLSLESLGVAERLQILNCFVPEMAYEPVEVMGLQFPNPVGLAAGLDKNGDYFNALGQIGFGFIEIGTITPRPQPGNPAPRIFRLPEAQALINRLGFNNKGLQHLAKAVKARRYRGILGINIGKNFDTPIDKAIDDYQLCMDQVYPLADYITVNLSSPNTPGLRDLQVGEQLQQLIQVLTNQRLELQQQHEQYTPIAVKISPDMNDEDLSNSLDILANSSIDAIIATNTTLNRDDVKQYPQHLETGGLSGAPLQDLSNNCIKKIKAQLGDAKPIIGVGGIMSADDAVAKMQAGASLVQCYTGFIYKGPQLIKDSVVAIGQNRTNND